jgi:predicted CXXCH cytochrome family protein
MGRFGTILETQVMTLRLKKEAAMMKESSPAAVSKMMIIISAFVIMVTASPDHFAWGMRTLGRLEINETCLFTVQLKEDPNIKKQYVAMVISAGRQFGPNVQSIDEMYADVSKASVEADDGGFGNTLFVKNNSHANGGARDIDNLTALCLGCHDGASAQDITVDVRNEPFKRRNTLATSHSDHPIGMDYNRYVCSGKSYKPTTNPKMIFVNGKVGCLTCHDPFNPEKGHLVMSDRQGALCLTCHNK